jgi:hypothetical protein
MSMDMYMVMKICWRTGDMLKIKCNNYETKKEKRFNYLLNKIMTNGKAQEKQKKFRKTIY